MSLEDLKRLATGSLLFSLDRIITPRLINLFYLLGLATIALWSVNHLFSTFAFGFGSGLWGLLEIAVFGLLGFVILRIVCETVIVFFKANEKAADAASRPHPATNLLDEVRDAIEDLAEEETVPALPAKSSGSTTSSRSKASSSSKSSPAKSSASSSSAKPARRPVRRSAKRSPARRSSK